MANFAASCPFSLNSLVLNIFSVFAFLLMNTVSAADSWVEVEPADARGNWVQHGCPSSSCGHLEDIHYPFRLYTDPLECGLPTHVLACSDDKAILFINRGRYYVTNISYSGSTFWVVDASLGNSSCTLPQRNLSPSGVDDDALFSATGDYFHPIYGRPLWATFVNCSQMIRNSMYRHVPCVDQNNSFVYVLASEESFNMSNLEPSCGYLAMIPLGDGRMKRESAATGVLKLMKNGFALAFPDIPLMSSYPCLRAANANFSEQISNGSTPDWISALNESGKNYTRCDLDARSVSVWPVIIGLRIMYIPLPQIPLWAKVIQLIVYPQTLNMPRWARVVIQWIFYIAELAIAVRFLLAPLTVFTFLAYTFWRTRMSVDAVEKFLQMQQAFTPTRYAYTDIIAITGHFREKLGQGGYGSVYKGVLPGDVHVAVKMLANSKCNGDEFISEVSTIGRIHHVNVVRLVGFCSEESKKALVYEYMPHGSLDKYIFSSERRLSWDKLDEIALSIARGIDYLHRGCDMQILHFDIKPHNILLDRNFTPKIADFGLAKLYPKDYSLVPVSAARGTIGYIAPELVSRSFGIISCKSDVYSFGMLLLEMAGGRRNADPNAENSSQAYYPAWVYNRLARQEVDEISEAIDMNEVERKLCIVGLRCIQIESHERPMMSEVVEMLQADVDGLDLPPKPFFCGDDSISVMDSLHFSSGLSVIIENE